MIQTGSLRRVQTGLISIPTGGRKADTTQRKLAPHRYRAVYGGGRAVG